MQIVFIFNKYLVQVILCNALETFTNTSLHLLLFGSEVKNWMPKYSWSLAKCKFIYFFPPSLLFIMRTYSYCLCFVKHKKKKNHQMTVHKGSPDLRLKENLMKKKKKSLKTHGSKCSIGKKLFLKHLWNKTTKWYSPVFLTETHSIEFSLKLLCSAAS